MVAGARMLRTEPQGSASTNGDAYNFGSNSPLGQSPGFVQKGRESNLSSSGTKSLVCVQWGVERWKEQVVVKYLSKKGTL